MTCKLLSLTLLVTTSLREVSCVKLSPDEGGGVDIWSDLVRVELTRAPPIENLNSTVVTCYNCSGLGEVCRTGACRGASCFRVTAQFGTMSASTEGCLEEYHGDQCEAGESNGTAYTVCYCNRDFCVGGDSTTTTTPRQTTTQRLVKCFCDYGPNCQAGFCFGIQCHNSSGYSAIGVFSNRDCVNSTEYAGTCRYHRGQGWSINDCYCGTDLCNSDHNVRPNTTTVTPFDTTTSAQILCFDYQSTTPTMQNSCYGTTCFNYTEESGSDWGRGCVSVHKRDGCGRELVGGHYYHLCFCSTDLCNRGSVFGQQTTTVLLLWVFCFVCSRRWNQ